jgi:hypothetical protein
MKTRATNIPRRCVMAASTAVLVGLGCGAERRSADNPAPPSSATAATSSPAVAHSPAPVDAMAGSAAAQPPTPVGAAGAGTAIPNATPSSSAGAGAAGASAGAGMPAANSAGGPTLPMIDDPAAVGPFSVERVETAPGLDTASLFVPSELGKDGVKHPIVVWTNGATGGISFYMPFLEHIATHGFFIVADKMSGANHDPEIAMQKAGIDWVVAENERADSPYAGKLEVAKIAIMGHSLGAIASFGNANDPRLATTVHWSGGLTGNPVGVDESWIEYLGKPVAFICGGSDGAAGPSCAADFMTAPEGIPVYYGTLAGVDHLGVFGETRGGEYGRAAVAWLRLSLASDASFERWFTGDGCQFCQGPWTGMSRGFN